MYIITHHDADGILSAATLMKAIPQKFWVYFSSPNRLTNTICSTILNTDGRDSLYICDISGNRKSVGCAAVYDRVVWLDHHVWEDFCVPENINLVVDPKSKSATRVTGIHTGILDFAEIADEIDTNNVVTETAERFRTITFAIKILYPRQEVYRALYDLTATIAEKGLGVIYRPIFDEMVARYNVVIEAAISKALSTKQDFTVGDTKVSIISMPDSIPIAPLFNRIENAGIDVLVFMNQRIDESSGARTKLEFRTQTEFDVLKIARAFGGGGHLFASGATVTGPLGIEQILEKIKVTYG
ncbi:MAG: hypothetical protein N3F63_00725 [Thermoplasmata archaeon]|nr:hypothetical protein [Thermoplasmata archaeon]